MLMFVTKKKKLVIRIYEMRLSSTIEKSIVRDKKKKKNEADLEEKKGKTMLKKRRR